MTNQPFSDDVAADCTRQPDKNERQCDTQSWDVVFRSKDALDKGLSERVQPLEHQTQGYKRRHEREEDDHPCQCAFPEGLSMALILDLLSTWPFRFFVHPFQSPVS